MKIGINASFLRKPDTGIGQVTTNFLRKLAGASDSPIKDTFVLYLEDDTNLEIPGDFQKRIYLPPYGRDDLVRRVWWEKYWLPRQAARDGCDVFLSLYQSSTVMPRKIRHVMVVHDVIPLVFPEYLDNLRKKMYQKLVERGIKKSERIISVSRNSEKDIIRYVGVGARKISVHYIDAGPEFKKPVSDEKKKKVLEKYGLTEGYLYHGGGLEKRKNTKRLLEAYGKLVDDWKKDRSEGAMPELVVSGKLLPQLAPLVTDVEKAVKEMGLSRHVRILDFVPRADLPALYAGSLAFLYPSLYEGFGLPVLEAMNMGVPVIAGRNSSLPEVGGDAVLYADGEDVDELARTIKKVVRDGNVRATMRERGKERVGKFSWDKFTRGILEDLKRP